MSGEQNPTPSAQSFFAVRGVIAVILACTLVILLTLGGLVVEGFATARQQRANFNADLIIHSKATAARSCAVAKLLADAVSATHPPLVERHKVDQLVAAACLYVPPTSAELTAGP